MMNPNNLNKFSIAEHYSGLADLEKQGHCLVEELQFSKNQLQQAHIKIQALTFSKLELEKILEKERKELRNTKSQLKIFQDAMQCWEKENLNDKNSAVVQSLQLEILQKEKISLNEEINDLQNKNIKLLLQMEETEKRSKLHSNLASLLNSNKKAFEKTVEEVYCESHKLEKELNFLKKSVSFSKHAGEQMIVLLKHHHEALNKLYKENESLKQTLFSRAGELNLEKTISKISHDVLDKIEVEILRKKLDESEKTISELNSELGSKMEEKKKLNETLNIVLSDQTKFNEMEQYFRTCIRNLENQLEKKFQSDVEDV